jgi:hypothetical protein
MKTIIKLILICFLSTNALAQERLNLKQFGFSLEEPKNWHKSGEQLFLENAKKYDWNDGQWQKIKQSHKGSVNVVAYHKYKADAYNGIIPTINLTISNNVTKTPEQFKQLIVSSHAQYKAMLDNFKLTSPLRDITIDGRKALICTSNYTINSPNGPVKLALKNLYIAKGSTYYVLNFIEEDGKEDNSAVFDKLIKTVKLTDVDLKK